MAPVVHANTMIDGTGMRPATDVAALSEDGRMPIGGRAAGESS